jgi:2-aminobenzoylacetyl-CoA thioesterase
MQILQSGQITKRIVMLGRSESCVYWVQDSGESVLLGGGMSYILPDLLRQVEALQLDERSLSSICILHSHFDHCGVVPFLKKRWPWIKIAGSERAGDLLRKPQIVKSIVEMNQKAAVHAGLRAAVPDFDVSDLVIERTLAEGDRLPCGSLDLSVIQTPGHSSCSISIYMAQEKALFASDAVGLHLNGEYQPTPNSNYDQYQQSIEKLSGYDADLICLEHFGVFTGEDARNFIPNARKAAQRTRRLIEDTYRRTGDLEACIREVTAVFMKRSADSFLSDEVRVMVAGQVVRYVAKAMERSSKP